MGAAWIARRLGAVLIAGLIAGLLTLGFATPAAADQSRPTADPGAPTPTAPYPGRPPQGFAPDGGTVGGEQLDTRGVVRADDTPAIPAGVVAHGWLVADADTGRVLAARDPHGRYYPASTLKTLTLLTLEPLLDPRRTVTGTVEDENIEGSRVGLVKGGRYSVSLLFRALVLQSGNDAANALARAAGGVGVTVAAMNETAGAIGAYDTVVGTPSGLDVAGQSSSPYDLALIFRALISRPTTAAILRTPTARMPGVAGRTFGYQIQNQDPLLTSYPGNLGGKTGFTDAARHTFVTAARRNGRRIVVSVMDTESRPLRASDQARLLLDWGFAVPTGTEGVGRLVTPADLAAADVTAAPAPKRADALGSRNGTATSDGGTTALVPAGVAALAALTVWTTVLARRRATRRESPPPPTGGSPSTPP